MPTNLNLAIGFYIGGLMVITYSAALWPLLFFLPQFWALSADRLRERQGRLLLVVLAPFSLLVAGQIIWMTYDLLPATACYCLGCLFATTTAFWRWLR